MMGLHSFLFAFICNSFWFSYLFSLWSFNISFMYLYESRYMVLHASTCQIIYGTGGGHIINSNIPHRCPGDKHVWTDDLEFALERIASRLKVATNVWNSSTRTSIRLCQLLQIVWPLQNFFRFLDCAKPIPKATALELHCNVGLFGWSLCEKIRLNLRR